MLFLKTPRERGEAAVLEQAIKFGEIKEGESYKASKEELKFAFDSLSEQEKVHTAIAQTHTFILELGRTVLGSNASPRM